MSVDNQENDEGLQNLPATEDGERIHKIDDGDYVVDATTTTNNNTHKCDERRRHLTIWDDSHVEKTLVNDGKKGWKCLHCTMHFSGEPNASKCLAHLTRTPGKHIKICCASIPSGKLAHYRTLQLELENRRRKKGGLNPITMEDLPKPVEGDKPIGPRSWEDSFQVLREYQKARLCLCEFVVAQYLARLKQLILCLL
jgi:hypothetical protein